MNKKTIDPRHADIAFRIMEGGASNAIALAYEADRMVQENEGLVVSTYLQALAAAGIDRNTAERDRLAGLLMEMANSKHADPTLLYPPVYIIVDQIRNICGHSCNSPLYWDRWAEMWAAVKEAAGES